MKEIEINKNHYHILTDHKNAINEEVLKEKITDYFDTFDYIVGDWAYGKLRLKGFNDKRNPHYNKLNDASSIESYIEDYCAYGCKYFILKKE